MIVAASARGSATLSLNTTMYCPRIGAEVTEAGALSGAVCEEAGRDARAKTAAASKFERVGMESN
jgi:hypothetical protein